MWGLAVILTISRLTTSKNIDKIPNISGLKINLDTSTRKTSDLTQRFAGKKIEVYSNLLIHCLIQI